MSQRHSSPPIPVHLLSSLFLVHSHSLLFTILVSYVCQGLSIPPLSGWPLKLPLALTTTVNPPSPSSGSPSVSPLSIWHETVLPSLCEEMSIRFKLRQQSQRLKCVSNRCLLLTVTEAGRSGLKCLQDPFLHKGLIFPYILPQRRQSLTIWEYWFF